MYTLYYSPGACSMAVHVALNELGVPYDLKEISLSKGENRSPEFLKKNPRGQVPVLEKDGKIYLEGAAILIHLLETHKSPLLPAGGPERDAAIQWLMFCNATLHPAFGPLFLQNHLVEKQPEMKNNPVFDIGRKRLQGLWDYVEGHLGQSPYLAGKSITVGDILLTVFANWATAFNLNLGPNVKRLVKEVSSCPSYQKALRTEKVEYKAAA